MQNAIAEVLVTEKNSAKWLKKWENKISKDYADKISYWLEF